MDAPLQLSQAQTAALESLQRQLRDGESLVWTGFARPELLSSSAQFARIAGVVIAGSAAASGLVLFAMPSLTTSAPAHLRFIALCSIPGVVFGLWLLMRVKSGLKRAAERTIYGITDRRAIVIEAAVMQDQVEVLSYEPSRLTAYSKTMRPDGTGSLVFESVSAGYSQNGQSVMRPRGFIGIDRVDAVEALLVKTLGLAIPH